MAETCVARITAAKPAAHVIEHIPSAEEQMQRARRRRAHEMSDEILQTKIEESVQTEIRKSMKGEV